MLQKSCRPVRKRRSAKHGYEPAPAHCHLARCHAHMLCAQENQHQTPTSDKHHAKASTDPAPIPTSSYKNMIEPSFISHTPRFHDLLPLSPVSPPVGTPGPIRPCPASTPPRIPGPSPRRSPPLPSPGGHPSASFPPAPPTGVGRGGTFRVAGASLGEYTAARLRGLRIACESTPTKCAQERLKAGALAVVCG